MRPVMGGLCLVLIVSGCGDDDGGDADAAPAIDAGQADGASCDPADPTGIVFLNKEAGTYTKGAMEDASLNVSQILDMDRTFSPYTGTAWPDVVTCMRDGLSPFAISVVETDPGDVDHTEVVFTNTPPAAWPGSSVGSISVYQCDPVARPHAFVFAGVFGENAQAICETALQQWAAATVSLDHAFKCQDYMTYLQGCGPKTWVDEQVECGESEPRNCTCGGSTQNSYQTLLDTFGAGCK